MIRRLFFNGFHPVFPWTAFLLIGMWLGRQDMRNRKTQRKVFFGGITAALVSECASWLLIRYFSANVSELDIETVRALFGTEAMPPMPLYLFASSGIATAIIGGCLMLTDKYPEAKWTTPFITTGQLALTLYVAHVVIGMGTLGAFGRLENQTAPFAIGSAGIFCICAVIFSYFWRKRFRRGPLEGVMRQMTG